MKRTSGIALALVAAMTLTGCGNKENTQANAQPAGTEAAATRVQSDVVPAAAPAASGQITGKVLETMDAAGYTYLKVATSDGEKWAAVSASPVKVGETVTIAEQMTAENFESKTLNRKFDKIIFGTIGGGTNAAPTAMGGGMMASSQKMPPGHPPTAGAAATGTPAQHMAGPKDVAVENIAKAEGGKSVAEIWAEKGSLNNKPVIVRGKVVKFLGGIMGKNWVHVRDGSGAEGTNDLTVTTDDVVAVGDIVTVRGTLKADKDFGAGYKYAVIVEDAKVSK